MGDYKLFWGSPGHYVDWYPPHFKRGGRLRLRKDKKFYQRNKNITLLYNIKSKVTWNNIWLRCTVKLCCKTKKS